MNQINDLIKSFLPAANWKDFIRENFDRKSNAYNFLSVTEIKVKFRSRVYHFPRKIIFDYGWEQYEKLIRKTEKFLLSGEKVTISETKRIIPFTSFERREKFSGEFDEILSDIMGTKNNFTCSISEELLQTGSNPLYGIDSLLEWPSYVMVLQNPGTISTPPVDVPDIWSDLLKGYGIHYAFDPSLCNTTIVIFPLRYVKIVENRIMRREKESILLVLEFNNLPLFYASKPSIELQAIVKDTNQRVVYEQRKPFKFEKARFQILDIIPDSPSEIAFAEIFIFINDTLVNRSSGYYLRNIKI